MNIATIILTYFHSINLDRNSLLMKKGLTSYNSIKSIVLFKLNKNWVKPMHI